MSSELQQLSHSARGERRVCFVVQCPVCQCVTAAFDPHRGDTTMMGEAVRHATNSGKLIGFMFGEVSIHLGGCKCNEFDDDFAAEEAFEELLESDEPSGNNDAGGDDRGARHSR